MVFELFVQSTQPGVLRRKASGTRNVDDQAQLAFEVCETNGFSVDRVHCEIVRCAHGAAFLFCTICTIADRCAE